MLWRRTHLSDAELLLLDEGELPPRRESYGRDHVAGCASCAARSRRLADTLIEIGHVHRESRERPPSPENLRARLRAEHTAGSLGSGWAHGMVLNPTAQGWTGAVAVVVVVVLALYVMDTARTRSDHVTVSPETGPIRPRPDLTPGAARPVSVSEVCGDAPVSAGPRMAPSVPQQVFQAYGADYRRSEEYELDLLITPELGGTTDVENLWPQPFLATPWNAYVKDELEHLLRRKVCEGSLDIETAQRQIATDWIAAYKRYFHTSRPLRDYGTAPIGPTDVEAWLSEAAEQRLYPQAKLDPQRARDG